MNNNIYQQQYKEIDFKDLLWKLLSQWKAILLISLVFSMIVAGAKYMKDKNAYNNEMQAREATAEQTKISAEERIDKILEAFSNEDIEAVNYVLREQEWLDGQKKYLEESIFMNIDPANRTILKLIYDIEGEDAKDIPVLLQEYAVFITGDEFREAVGKVIDASADSRYIGELIGYSSLSGPEVDTGQTGAVLIVHVVLPDNTDAGEVEKISGDLLAGFAKKIQNKYTHTLSAAGSDISHEYNNDYVFRHYDTLSRINALSSAVTNAKNELSEEQIAAVEAIEKIKRESADFTNEVTVANSDELTDDDTLIAPGLSKKYMLLGFILGAFLYVGIYVVLLILREGINSVASVQRFTCTRPLGEVYYEDYHKGFADLFHSKLIKKLRHPHLPDMISQTGRITDSVDALCKHANIKEITFFNMTGEKSENKSEVIDSLISGVKKNGLKIVFFDVSDDIDEKAMLDMNDTILAVTPDTKTSVLGKVMSLCRDYDINILGNVYIAEM